MWYRYWPYAASFMAGVVLTLLVQVSWAYGCGRAKGVAQWNLTLQEGKAYRVLRVIDGDTVALANGLHVRYAGVNTPEKGRFVSDPAPLAEAATLRNRELVEGREVRLRLGGTPVDAYGRVVARVVALDPGGSETDVEAVLLKEGLGRVMGIGLMSEEYHRLKALQEEARAAKQGIWSLRDATDSGVLEAAPFCAASHGKVFHRSGCPQARRIGVANRVVFATVEEARASGRLACRQCAEGE